MRTRTSPVILGFIWGMFSMLLSFALVSVFASLQLEMAGFPLFAYNTETQYLIIGAVFLLSVLGAIGAGIAHRLPKLGGTFLLISCAGVALFLFVPVLAQSFSFSALEAYGIHIGPFELLIADFTMIVFTVLGLMGGILAFIPKKDRKALKQPQFPKHARVPMEAAPVQPVPPPAPAVTPSAMPVQPAPAAPTADVPPDIVPAAPPPSDINLMNLE